jgi:hypothetical protein
LTSGVSLSSQRWWREIRCSEVGCSEVEVCWNANPNRRYTVEYRSDQTAHQWKELVGPVTTNCVRDAVGPDDTKALPGNSDSMMLCLQ